MPTAAEMIHAHAEAGGVAVRFEDQRWTYPQLAAAAAARATLLAARPRGEGRPHVGVLLDNVPEFLFWLAAAAVGRSVIVGVNPTRRGAELERDIRSTDCRWMVTDREHVGLLEGLDTGVPPSRLLVVDDPAYAQLLDAAEGTALPPLDAEPDDLYVLFFTSGTTGTPKAVRCSQGRLMRAGGVLAERFDVSGGVYQAMPMFHSNALLAGVSPAWSVGAPVVLRRRFSASGWLPDVRRYAPSYFNYVGKPLAYILATPERPDDADNPVRVAFGNEANPWDIEAFGRRFGCLVVDGYGSSEGGASISRTPETPTGALGKVSDDTRILDPDTQEECPAAAFDADGRLLNAADAIGEIATRSGPRLFEGYYRNAEADAERVHDGWYWTGDLAYCDADGFIYFAGRGHDWARVDGENFATAPVEAIVARHPDVMLVAAYAVPDPRVGDQVMVAVQLRPGGAPVSAIDEFVRAQADLGTKWAPRFWRVVDEMPMTATAKVQKKGLRASRWEADGPVWWRPSPGEPLALMSAADRAALREEFAAHGRLGVLDLV
jgi:fatty-acyl-CoA synthase